ncbi:MAG TPA: hypothetical protein VIH86_10825, partial [Puia sp.]
MKWLKALNDALSPWASLIGFLTVFIVTTVSVYSYFFRPLDLSVFVNKQEVNFPISINNKYATVWNYLVANCKDSA